MASPPVAPTPAAAATEAATAYLPSGDTWAYSDKTAFDSPAATTVAAALISTRLWVRVG